MWTKLTPNNDPKNKNCLTLRSFTDMPGLTLLNACASKENLWKDDLTLLFWCFFGEQHFVKFIESKGFVPLSSATCMFQHLYDLSYGTSENAFLLLLHSKKKSFSKNRLKNIFSLNISSDSKHEPKTSCQSCRVLFMADSQFMLAIASRFVLQRSFWCTIQMRLCPKERIVFW